MTAHITETCICRWWRAFKGLRGKERGWHDQTHHLERLSWKNEWAGVWEDFGKLRWGVRWLRSGNVGRGFSQEALKDWLRLFGWRVRRGRRGEGTACSLEVCDWLFIVGNDAEDRKSRVWGQNEREDYRDIKNEYCSGGAEFEAFIEYPGIGIANYCEECWKNSFGALQRWARHSSVVTVDKNPLANAGDTGLIPGSGRSQLPQSN